MNNGLLGYPMALVVLIGILTVACSHKHEPDQNIETHPPQKIISLTTRQPVYHSTDGGLTWSEYAIGIPQEAKVSSFLVDGNTIYATTDYTGIYSIKNGETRWSRIDQDLPNNIDINAIAKIHGTFIIVTRQHGILISTNNGSTWKQVPTAISQIQFRSLLSTSTIVLAGADDGIYKSTDDGASWTQVYKGVQVNGFTTFKNKIYAAASNGAVMTTDNGVNWKYIYKPLALHDISNDGEFVYGFTLGGGLIKSSDDGLTWENVNKGFGAPKFYTFELKNIGNNLFAAQWHGIYYLEKGTKSWERLKNGLPDSTAFTTLEINGNELIAGIGLR